MWKWLFYHSWPINELISMYSQFISLKTEKNRNKDPYTTKCRPIFFLTSFWTNELYIQIDAVFHALSEYDFKKKKKKWRKCSKSRNTTQKCRKVIKWPGISRLWPTKNSFKTKRIWYSESGCKTTSPSMNSIKKNFFHKNSTRWTTSKIKRQKHWGGPGLDFFEKNFFK